MEEFAGLLQRANSEKSIQRHVIPLPKRYMQGLQPEGSSRGKLQPVGSYRGKIHESAKGSAYAPESQESEDRDFELEEAWIENSQ